MMRPVLALFAGLVFGCGILLSGMANPAKIINFFDVFGSFDPSLIFVMGGALLVTAIGYRLVWLRSRPLAAESFQVPVTRTLDRRLLLGSALFGIGWGLAGFCPGGSIPALGLMRPEPLVFVAALVIGIFAGQRLDRLWSAQRSGAAPRGV